MCVKNGCAVPPTLKARSLDATANDRIALVPPPGGYRTNYTPFARLYIALIYYNGPQGFQRIIAAKLPFLFLSRQNTFSQYSFLYNTYDTRSTNKYKQRYNDYLHENHYKIIHKYII